MVVTEPPRGTLGTRGRPLSDPNEVRRILDDRDRFMPSFADLFTAEDDVIRARQLDWQDRADPGHTGEFSEEWRGARAAAAERLVRSTEALASAIARGVLVRVREEPHRIDREIVAPAIADALHATFAPTVDALDPTFPLGLTPAASDDQERLGSDAACALARADGEVDDPVRLAVEATADSLALLGNAIPGLEHTRLAMLDDGERARLAETLAHDHRPRAGALRIVRAATVVGDRTCEAGEELWLDLRAASRRLGPGTRLDDRWDPLVAASIDLSKRCLTQLVALVFEHKIHLVSPEPGEERGTFFWREQRGGTVARQ
jgi:hypothetical protein